MLFIVGVVVLIGFAIYFISYVLPKQVAIETKLQQLEERGDKLVKEAKKLLEEGQEAQERNIFAK